MRYVIIFILLAIAGTFMWRHTTPALRKQLWRALRFYLAAVAVSLLSLYVILVFVMHVDLKFL